MSAKFQKGLLTPFAGKILCYNLAGCDDVDNYFATESDTMIDIRIWIKISLEYIHLTFNRNVY